VRTTRGGEKLPASPRDDTLAAVARAVGLDPADVFDAADREYVAPPDSADPPSLEDRVAALERELAELRSKGEPTPAGPSVAEQLRDNRRERIKVPNGDPPDSPREARPSKPA
jgi:hypothetical protein